MKNFFRDNPLLITISAFIVVVLIALGATLYFTTYNDHTYIITVTDKERIVTGTSENMSSKYLIFCEDENGEEKVLENTDTLFRFKFNSSDIYGQLDVGSTYKVTVVGYRVPFFSMYENIIEVEDASS